MLWITIRFWARLSLGQARLVLHLQSLHWHSFQYNDQYAHYNTQLMLINHHKLGRGRAGQGRAGQGRAGQDAPWLRMRFGKANTMAME